MNSLHSALKDEQIKKFTRQREFLLAMASGRVEFSSPELAKKKKDRSPRYPPNFAARILAQKIMNIFIGNFKLIRLIPEI